MNAGFEGRLYAPGALIDFDDLPEHPVVLECAGPQGHFQRGKRRDTLYILWRWDWQRNEWREIGRALALNWEWATILRTPAIRALHPQPEFMDVLQRGRDVASEIMGEIERRLEGEPQPVKANALAAVYDQVAGRIAAA